MLIVRMKKKTPTLFRRCTDSFFSPLESWRISQGNAGKSRIYFYFGIKRLRWVNSRMYIYWCIHTVGSYSVVALERSICSWRTYVWRMSCLIARFTILEHRHQEIGEVYVVQKRLSTSLKLQICKRVGRVCSCAMRGLSDVSESLSSVTVNRLNSSLF